MSRLSYYTASLPTLIRGFENWPLLFKLAAGGRRSGAEVLRLKGGLRFHVNTLMDAWIIKETCLDRQYERVSVPLEDGWAIVDVGAALGDFAVSVGARFPSSTVCAYEPFPESHALLLENIALNGTRNVRAYPFAVSSSAGSLSLKLVSGEAVQHSTATAAGTEAVTVRSTTLEQILAENDLARIDYLKMDCEGGEYDILLNAAPRTLQRIHHLCLEYHDGVTAHSHGELAAFLESHGFGVRLTPNPVHANLGFLYAWNAGQP